MTAREHVRLFCRTIGYIYKLEKGYTIYSVVAAALKGVFPYISIYFFSLILNDLQRNKSFSELLWKVVQVVAVNFFTQLLIRFLEKMCESRKNQLFRNEQLYLAKKGMRLEYPSLEDSNVVSLRESIRLESQTGHNLFYFTSNLEKMVYSMTGFAIAVLFLFSFLAKIKKNTGYLLTGIVMLIFSAFLHFVTQSKVQEKESRFLKSAVKTNQMAAYLDDYITDYRNGKEIRIYGMGGDMLQAYVSFQETSDKLLKNYKRSKMVGDSFKQVLQIILQIAVYLWIICSIEVTQIEVGDIVKTVSSVLMLLLSLQAVITGVQNLKNNHFYLKKYFTFLDLPEERKEMTGNVTESCKNRILKFEHVSFCYPGSKTMALSDLNMEIDLQSCMAIVGKNGSGKSTLVKLIVKLYKPTKGAIYLNGRNIWELDTEQYRKLISVVFQDFFLISYKLGSNVAASEYYDKEKVQSCLSKAGLTSQSDRGVWNLESLLYKDFDDNGIELSGGEAQKIAIARALYRAADFMILDEPTAALDPLSEMEIYYTIHEISKKKGVMYISHRLSSCKFCDEILVLENGSLAERGSHHHLLQENGLYQELWSVQAGFYQ